jgi:hypothetical protein
MASHCGGPSSNSPGRVGFVVNKMALGQVFFRVIWVSLPIIIPPISPQSPSPIIRGWYNRPVVAAVPKVPPHKLKENICRCSLSAFKGRLNLYVYIVNNLTGFKQISIFGAYYVCLFIIVFMNFIRQFLISRT